MNVRKPADYSAMFAALDALMAAALPQVELYCEIGGWSAAGRRKARLSPQQSICAMCTLKPPVSPPRNLRRMREFYRTYGNAPEVLAEAMTIGWTQNVVILESELALQEQAWYIQAVRQFGWSKLELQRKIKANAYLETALDFTDDLCYTVANRAGEPAPRQENSATACPYRLRPVRPPNRDGSSRPAEHTLRRRFRGKAPPADRVYRPPRSGV